jgi:hypothetical protein
MSLNQKVTVPVGSPATAERAAGDPAAGAGVWAPVVNRSLTSMARSSRTSRPNSAGVRKYR